MDDPRAPIAAAAAAGALACWCARASAERPTVTFLTAWSGVGKTTTGDYLGTYCGLHHIDGDDDMRRPDDATRAAATQGLVKSFYGHWFKDQPAPAELWHPFHQLLCDRVVDALSSHRDVVVSFSVYRREVRDFLREHLKSHAEVRFIKLECDVDVVVKGALARVKDFMSLRDKTVEEWWAEGENEKKYGEFSFDNYKRMQFDTVLSGFEPLGEDEADCTVVDVSARDASCFDRVGCSQALLPLLLSCAASPAGALRRGAGHRWLRHRPSPCD